MNFEKMKKLKSIILKNVKKIIRFCNMAFVENGTVLNSILLIISKDGKREFQRVIPRPITMSSYEPPIQLSGIPVLENEIGEPFVLLTHLLESTLICPCNITNHHGLFKTKRRREHEIKIDSSTLFGWWNNDKYNITKLRSITIGIKMNGVEEWVKTGNMKKFIDREYLKCEKKGCFKNKTKKRKINDD